MKYNNKYALALVLLASAAFASGSDTLPNYDGLLAKVNEALKSKGTNKFIDIDPTAKASLGLTSKQLAAFEAKAEKELNDNEIKSILNAADIIDSAGEKPISDKPGHFYPSLLTPEQYKAIAEFEYKSGKILTQDELIEFLKDSSNLPSYSFDSSADAISERLVKLANGGKISAITDDNRYKYDISDIEFSTIKAVEDALNAPLSKDQLKYYFANKNFHNLTVEIRVKAILATGPNELHLFATDKQSEAIKSFHGRTEEKADEALITKILNSSDEELAEMMATTPVASDGSTDENKSEQGQSPDPSSTTPSASDIKGDAC